MLKRLQVSLLQGLGAIQGPTQSISHHHGVSLLLSRLLSTTSTQPLKDEPSPSIQNQSDTSTHGSQSLSEQFSDLAPVILCPQPCRVVVIGWMGSRSTYIKKYIHLWERTGDHSVITIRPTIAQTLLRFRGVVTAGSDIDKVARLHMENPAMPTFYHIFSTGGFIHAGTMWRWMDEVEDVMMRTSLLDEAAGIIIDSAPCLDLTPNQAARALVSSISGLPVESLDPSSSTARSSNYSSLIKPLVPPTETFMKYWMGCPSMVERRDEVEEAWTNRAPSCPQLYLYSDSDPLVPQEGVEDFMRAQSDRGVEVEGHMFRGSGHCEHFRSHPHEYAMQISQFVSKASENW